MLSFFRKYQKYIYLVVTVVIIISFSFFGTYGTIQQGDVKEEVAFVAIDGTPVMRSELEQMVYFIKTDSEDKQLFGGAWGPNFLNDGVLKKDILQTGLAQVLAAEYRDLLAKELRLKFEKEKRFSPYTHPQARFVGAESAWSYLAPDIKENFDLLRRQGDAANDEAVNARVNLFLAERKLPSPALRQVLHYQQKQYGWLPPDPNLDYTDLSLFGYHTVEDWFGPSFLRLVAEFVINSSIIAEEKGYEVSRNEAYADLIRNNDISFQKNASNPNLGVRNSGEYFSEQLVRMRMDSTQAVKLWRKVLLFRRLYNDAGNAVIVDSLSFAKFYDYANESVEGVLYQLPEPLRFNNFETMQKFEVYLDATSKRKQASLDLPTSFKSVEEVSQETPQLVQREYKINYVQTNKRDLEATISLKQTWDWEVKSENWEKIKQKFPELGIKKANTNEERYAALEELNEKTRSRVDMFARDMIIEEHPEWIQEALASGTKETKEIGVRLQGGSPPLVGIEDTQAFREALDSAYENKSGIPLIKGGDTFYSIEVLDRSPNLEILTFAKAINDGTLDDLLNSRLELVYQKNKEKFTKPFSEVKNEVANIAFKELLDNIYSDYASVTPKDVAHPELVGDVSASLRFYKHVRQQHEKLRGGDFKNDSSKNQWALIENPSTIVRSAQSPNIDKKEVLALNPGGWSAVHTSPNGDITFFHALKKDNTANHALFIDNVTQAHRNLTVDAQKTLGLQMVQKMNEKNAISLDYMRREYSEE